MSNADRNKKSLPDRKDSNKKTSNGSSKNPLEHTALNKRPEIAPSDADSFYARKEAASALKNKEKAKLKKAFFNPKTLKN